LLREWIRWQRCELFAAGFRNTYDIDFSPDGETVSGFDSDMEWDWGTPWYRPTRVKSHREWRDYGFREGTAKWPNGYPDSLRHARHRHRFATGVKFGFNAHFPDAYRAAHSSSWTGRTVESSLLI